MIIQYVVVTMGCQGMVEQLDPRCRGRALLMVKISQQEKTTNREISKSLHWKNKDHTGETTRKLLETGMMQRTTSTRDEAQREAQRLIYTGKAGAIEHRWNTWGLVQTITRAGHRTKTGSEEWNYKIKQETEHREWKKMRHRNKSYTNINTGINMKHKEVIIKLKTPFIKRWT